MNRVIPIALALIIGACSENKEQPDQSEASPQETTEDTVSQSLDTIEVADTPEVDAAPLIDCLESVDGVKVTVTQCLDEHSEILNTISSSLADSLLLLSYTRLNATADRVPIDLDWEEMYDENFNIRPDVAEQFSELGYELDSEEGTPFLKPDWKALSAYFTGKLSEAGETYLAFKRDYPQKISYDAGLIISPDEYAERLMLQEKILTEHPNFVGYEDIQESMKWELNWFFFGMDNTPSRDWESGEPLEEWMNAWKKASKKGGPVLKYYVDDWLKKIDSNSGKTPELVNYPYIDPEQFMIKLKEARGE